MNAWLNLVKVSVRTKMFSLPLLEGSTLVKSMHSRPIGLLAIIVPGFVFNLYSHPLLFGTVDRFSHSWLHPET